MPFNPLDSLYQEMANIKHVEFCSQKKKKMEFLEHSNLSLKKKKKETLEHSHQ